MFRWKHLQKPTEATKGICLVWFFEMSKTRTSHKEQHKATTERQEESCPQNEKEQQKVTKSIFHSHFHSFAPILVQWKNWKTRTGKGKERRAAKSNKRQKGALWSKNQTSNKKPKGATNCKETTYGNQAL